MLEGQVGPEKAESERPVGVGCDREDGAQVSALGGDGPFGLTRLFGGDKPLVQVL